MTQKLATIGYRQNKKEPCVFHKMMEGKLIRMAFHVDDGKISAPTRLMERVIAEINGVLPLSKVQRGPTLHYLGMRICQSPGVVTVDMIEYTRDCIKFFGPCGEFDTPATGNLFVNDPDCRELDAEGKSIFHTGTAKLLFMSKRTRADIELPVNVLTSRVAKPNESDWHKLCRVYGYLARNIYYGVKFTKPLGSTTIEAWADASYLVHDDAKSRTGGVIKINGGVVAVMSSKQKIVTKSSSEAELVALGELVSSVLGIREFVSCEDITLPATTVNEDNKACMDLVAAGKSTSSRTKHIRMRYFFVKQHVTSGEIVLRWCETAEMLADFLRKPLTGAQFIELRGEIVAVIGY
jgi:hypothetical protein